MKVENYLAKFYDVNVVQARDAETDAVLEGVEQIEIYERGEDSEPIGWFLKSDKSDSYEWRNIYGKVGNCTIFANAAAVKASAKRHEFYPVATINIAKTNRSTLVSMSNKLAASADIVHGSAYTAIHAAMSILRRLAGVNKGTELLTYPDLATAAIELRKFAPTVAQPASGRMTEAAAYFDELARLKK